MKSKKITYLAFFVALGILLPQIFHMLGGPGLGSMILPMHIPVLVGAMILGPLSGMIIGMVSVIVGAMMGMPAMPMALFMFFELSAYGLVAGYLCYTKKLNIYISLIGAMIAGRAVSLGVMLIVIKLFGFNLPPIFGTIAIFSAGIPGMIIQLILVPILVMAVRRFLDGETI